MVGTNIWKLQEGHGSVIILALHTGNWGNEN